MAPLLVEVPGEVSYNALPGLSLLCTICEQGEKESPPRDLSAVCCFVACVSALTVFLFCWARSRISRERCSCGLCFGNIGWGEGWLGHEKKGEGGGLFDMYIQRRGESSFGPYLLIRWSS